MDKSTHQLYCTKCHKNEFYANYKEQREHFQQMVESFVSTLLPVNQETAEQVLRKCLSLLKKVVPVLGDGNAYVVRVLDASMDSCIMSEQWAEAVQYGERTFPAYRKLLPQYHPNLGIQLLRVGKLKLFLGNFQGALKDLQEAGDILCVTHGKDHSLLYTIEQYIIQAKMEGSHSTRSPCT